MYVRLLRVLKILGILVRPVLWIRIGELVSMRIRIQVFDDQKLHYSSVQLNLLF
jgi:hypothetical protein